MLSVIDFDESLDAIGTLHLLVADLLKLLNNYLCSYVIQQLLDAAKVDTLTEQGIEDDVTQISKLGAMGLRDRDHVLGWLFGGF